MLYAASSIALACLEILVHLVDTTTIPDFVYSEIEVPDELVQPWTESEGRTEAILASNVLSREFGDVWSKHLSMREALSHRAAEVANRPVQQVPSAVVHPEWNYLINPDHPDFAEISWSEPRAFRIDRRLIDPALR
jgi:RES domain-containing protein